MHSIRKEPFHLKILLPTPYPHQISHMDVYNKKRPGRRIPTFGSWESYEGIPLTSYFESADHRVFRHYSYSGDRDLYQCVYGAVIPFPTSQGIVGRVKDSKERWGEDDDLEGFPRTRVDRLSRPNSKPVDEDLYQIPVQLVHTKAKRKKQRSGFFTRCLLPVICV